MFKSTKYLLCVLPPKNSGGNAHIKWLMLHENLFFISVMVPQKKQMQGEGQSFLHREKKTGGGQVETNIH